MFASRTVGAGTEMLSALLQQMNDQLPDLSTASYFKKSKMKLDRSIKENAIKALEHINTAIMDDHAQLSEYQQYANIFTKATLYIRRWIKITNKNFSFPLFKSVDSKVRMKQVYNDAKQTAKDAFPSIDFSDYEKLMDKLMNEVELLSLMKENIDDLDIYLKELYNRFREVRENYELDDVDNAESFAENFDILFLDAQLITPEEYRDIRRGPINQAGDPFDDKPEVSHPAPGAEKSKSWLRLAFDKLKAIFYIIIEPFRFIFGKSSTAVDQKPVARDAFNQDWTAATDPHIQPRRLSRSRPSSRLALRSRSGSRTGSEADHPITPSTAYVPSALRRRSRSSLASADEPTEASTDTLDPNASFFGVKH